MANRITLEYFGRVDDAGAIALPKCMRKEISKAFAGKKIRVGRSLLMSPFNHFFTWQTTVVTEIIASEPDSSYIKFKTENSTYELFKL